MKVKRTRWQQGYPKLIWSGKRQRQKSPPPPPA